MDANEPNNNPSRLFDVVNKLSDVSKRSMENDK